MSVDRAFEVFKEKLKEHFDAVKITDEVKLRELFEEQLDSMVDAVMQSDAEGGSLVDELYGDGIFNCVEFRYDEDSDD